MGVPILQRTWRSKFPALAKQTLNVFTYDIEFKINDISNFCNLIMCSIVWNDGH